MAIGAAMLIPGVSGGTTAIILGIYDRLIRAVSDLTKHFKSNFFFLMQTAVAGLIGVLVFSKAVLWLTDRFYFPMRYFFIGAILGSVPLMLKKADIKGSNLWQTVFILPGVLMAVGLNFLPRSELTSGNIWLLPVCGLVIAAALVLPGISTSHILLVLGMYETVLQAIVAVNWLYIGILGISVTAGILLCTKFLEKAMNHFPVQTFLMITGFVMASVYDIFPGVPASWEILPSCVMLAGAFVLVWILSCGEHAAACAG